MSDEKIDIDTAVQNLKEHLGEDGVFSVRHDGTSIIVNVNFIYRREDIAKLGGQWQGYPIRTGRISCW